MSTYSFCVVRITHKCHTQTLYIISYSYTRHIEMLLSKTFTLHLDQIHAKNSKIVERKTWPNAILSNASPIRFNAKCQSNISIADITHQTVPCGA